MFNRRKITVLRLENSRGEPYNYLTSRVKYAAPSGR
jgi:hypothetical protein